MNSFTSLIVGAVLGFILSSKGAGAFAPLPSCVRDTPAVPAIITRLNNYGAAYSEGCDEPRSSTVASSQNSVASEYRWLDYDHRQPNTPVGGSANLGYEDDLKFVAERDGMAGGRRPGRQMVGGLRRESGYRHEGNMEYYQNEPQQLPPGRAALPTAGNSPTDYLSSLSSP